MASIPLAAILLAFSAAVSLGANSDTYLGYEYGNMFYLGPMTGGQYITKATYSLSVPTPPSDYVQSKADSTWLALWIGLQDDPSSANVLGEEFVQPLVNWAPDNERYGCSADIEHFCAAASTYTPGGQLEQAYVPVPTNAQLDFEVSVDSSGSIVQTISMGGDVISTQTGSQGMKPAVFYSGTECYDNGCGNLPAHTWSNITLHLNEADSALDQILTLTGATSSGMETSDNGRTWTIDSIVIEKQDLTAGSGSSSSMTSEPSSGTSSGSSTGSSWWSSLFGR